MKHPFLKIIEKFKKIGRWCVPKDNVTIVFGESFKANKIACDKITSAHLAEYTQEKVKELKDNLVKLLQKEHTTKHKEEKMKFDN